MSFLGNQIINMMINKIKSNNPKLTPYIEEIQRGGNTTEILQKAISNGVISRQQWNQAKPLLTKYSTQLGMNISSEDINSIEQVFNTQSNNINYPNNTGFRF